MARLPGQAPCHGQWHRMAANELPRLLQAPILLGLKGQAATGGGTGRTGGRPMWAPFKWHAPARPRPSYLLHQLREHAGRRAGRIAFWLDWREHWRIAFGAGTSSVDTLHCARADSTAPALLGWTSLASKDQGPASRTPFREDAASAGRGARIQPSVLEQREGRTQRALPGAWLAAPRALISRHRRSPSMHHSNT